MAENKLYKLLIKFITSEKHEKERHIPLQISILCFSSSLKKY